MPCLKEKIVKLEINKDITLKTLITNDTSLSYIEWMNDPEVVLYTEQRGKIHTFASINSYIYEKFNSKNCILFGVFIGEEHIGNIKMGDINWNDMTSEISYVIGKKKYWGKGITTKCVNHITEYGFLNLGIKKFIAGYYELNLASAKVLSNCGFSIETTIGSDMFVNNKQIKILKVSKLKSLNQ